jgi:ferredoxin--NADP+ reductase
LIDGVFLTGWARKASQGLVGVAKRDGEWCAKVVARYLDTKAPLERRAADDILRRLQQRVAASGVAAVGVDELRLLESAEKECVERGDCIGEFKFSTNELMLEHIRRRKSGQLPTS